MNYYCFVFFFILLAWAPLLHAQDTHWTRTGGNFASSVGVQSSAFTPSSEDATSAPVRQKHGEAAASSRFTYAYPSQVSAKASDAPAGGEGTVSCMVCRQEIAKNEGYSILPREKYPKHQWYVHKNSSCACDYFKQWLKEEKQAGRLDFNRQAEERQACEGKVGAKYHYEETCSVCGKPINTACGPVAVYKEGGSTHYGHKDCVDRMRHEKEKKALLAGLEIDETACLQTISEEEQLRISQANAQEMKQELQKSVAALAASQKKAPAVRLAPAVRPPEQIQKDYEEFMASEDNRKQIKNASAKLRKGKTLKGEELAAYRRYEALRREMQLAHERASGSAMGFSSSGRAVAVKSDAVAPKEVSSAVRQVSNAQYRQALDEFVRENQPALQSIAKKRKSGAKLSSDEEKLYVQFQKLHQEIEESYRQESGAAAKRKTDEMTVYEPAVDGPRYQDGRLLPPYRETLTSQWAKSADEAGMAQNMSQDLSISSGTLASVRQESKGVESQKYLPKEPEIPQISVKPSAGTCSADTLRKLMAEKDQFIQEHRKTLEWFRDMRKQGITLEQVGNSREGKILQEYSDLLARINKCSF